MKDKAITHMDRESWIDFAAAACTDAGIAYDAIEIVTTWDQKFRDSDGYRNNAVFRIGSQRCLKIYGPTAARQFHIERSVLRTLADQNTIPAARLVTDGGHIQDRPYLIMTEIAGSSAEDIWESLSRSEQLAIAREIGAITAAIHHLPHPDIATVEQEFGGRNEECEEQQAHRIEEIKSANVLSIRQRDALLQFLLVEAWEFVNSLEPQFTHFDLSHAHIYLARETGTLKVAGFIDWAEAMLGPSEWDIAYHWFWTFSGDREAMRQCLQTYYADSRQPERLARRCLATFFYTYSMGLLWPKFVEEVHDDIESIVDVMIESFFPAMVFGLPD